MKYMNKSFVFPICMLSAVFGSSVAIAANDFTDVSAAFAAEFTTVNSYLNKAIIVYNEAVAVNDGMDDIFNIVDALHEDYQTAVDGIGVGLGDGAIEDAVSQYKAAYAAYETSLDTEENSASDVSATFISAGLATTEVGRTRGVLAGAWETIAHARDAAKLLKQADVTGVTQAEVDTAKSIFDGGTMDSAAYDTAFLVTAETVNVANGATAIDVPVTAEVIDSMAAKFNPAGDYAENVLYEGSPAITLINDDVIAIREAHAANVKVANWKANGSQEITTGHLTTAKARYDNGVIEDITQVEIDAAVRFFLVDGAKTEIDVDTAQVIVDYGIMTQSAAETERETIGLVDADSNVLPDTLRVAFTDGADPGAQFQYNIDPNNSAHVNAAKDIIVAGVESTTFVVTNSKEITVTVEEAKKIVKAYDLGLIIDKGGINQADFDDSKLIVSLADDNGEITEGTIETNRALVKAGVIDVLTQARYDAAKTLVGDMVGVDAAVDAVAAAEADLIEAIKDSDDEGIKTASKALESATTAIKNAIIVNTKVADAISAVNAGTMSVRAFNEKIKPDAGVAMSGAMSGVTVVNNTVTNYQNTIVASSGKYGLSKHSGVNAGSVPLSMGVWLKVFGSDSEMDTRDSVAGYDADIHGVVIGVDQIIGDDLLVGIALSFADIDMEGKSTARSITDTDQIQGTLYGTMFMSDFFINGSLAYAHSSSDTERTGFGGVVTGEYDTSTYSASLGAGMPIDMDSYAITPQVTLAYSYVDPDSYTESGFGALNVSPDSMDLFGIKVGVTINKKLIFDGGVLSPKFRMIADWDVLQERAQVNSSWASTGTTITPIFGAEPAALGGIFGAGIDYATDDGAYVFSLDYDLSTRSDFVSHAASAQFRLNF